MSVEFDEDNFGRKTYSNYTAASGGTTEAKGMAKWLISNGLAKNNTSANIIMIIIMLLVFVVAIYIFRNGLKAPFVPVPPVQGPVPLEDLL